MTDRKASLLGRAGAWGSFDHLVGAGEQRLRAGTIDHSSVPRYGPLIGLS